MKKLFNKIFGKQKKDEPQRETSPLEVLAYAISDVGLFTWYSAELPKYVQLEFNWAMLFFEPRDNNTPPSNQIALQFRKVKSVYTFKDSDSQLSDNWLDLLNEDKLEPFNVNYEFFSFDTNEIKKMSNSLGIKTKIYGEDLENLTENNSYKIGFKAGEIGMIICADEMKIMTHSGEIKLNSIPEIHNEWWKYWKKYWELMDSKNKLPYDSLCEITIPAEK